MWKAELVRNKLSYLRISPRKILMVPLGFFLLLGIKCVKKERIWGGKKCWTRRNQNLSWCLFSLSLILRFTQLLFVSIVHTFVFSSVQLLSHVWLFAIPWAAAHQAFLSVANFRSLNSCPSSWWCHPTILSSVVPYSYCLQSFPTTESFPMSQFFASGGQSIGVLYYWLVICGLLNHHPLNNNWVLSSFWQWWIE